MVLESELVRALTIDFVWQTSLLMGLGLAGSFIWSGRPARAHRWLILVVAASFIAAPLSTLVRAADWGWFDQAGGSVLMASQSSARTLDAVSGNNAARPLLVVPEAAEIALDTVRFSLSSLAAPIVAVWAGVSVLLFIRLARSFVQGRKLVARATACHDPAIERALADVSGQIQLSRQPELGVAGDITSPMIWCWRRPAIILLPDAVLRRAHLVDWRAIFAHELAHLKRRDHLSFLAVELLTCLMPWNPLAWWTRRRLGELAEWSCDDWAVASGGSPVTYAESILNLLPQAWPTHALAAVRHTRGMAGRIHAILADRRHEPRSGVAWSTLACAAAVSLVAVIAFAQGTNLAPSPRTVNERDTTWWTHWESHRELVETDPIFDVRPTSTTDAYVDVHLRDAHLLHTLSLEASQITDRSLVTIGRLASLRSVTLAQTGITDAGLAHLVGAPSLELINLRETGVTDVGLEYLARIPTLTTINLTGCPVTASGVARLERALPGATVIVGP